MSAQEGIEPFCFYEELTRDTGESEDSYERVYNNDNFEEHKSKLSHEVIAGGAAFAGFKAFEDSQRREGQSLQPPS